MDSATILELAGLIIGTNSITGFIVALLTIRYSRQKAKGEAHGAKYDGMKVEQDTYQELIEDLNADRKRMKEDAKEREAYISELKEDRRLLREERDELRNEVNKLRETQYEQADKIARLGRLYNALKPLICSNLNCPQRQGDIMGLVSDDSFDTKEERNEGDK